MVSYTYKAISTTIKVLKFTYIIMIIIMISAWMWHFYGKNKPNASCLLSTSQWYHFREGAFSYGGGL